MNYLQSIIVNSEPFQCVTLQFTHQAEVVYMNKLNVITMEINPFCSANSARGMSRALRLAQLGTDI